MKTLDTFMKPCGPREHYAAHGKNASKVVRSRYRAMASLGVGGVTKTTTLAIRKGRDDEGEAVQIEVTIEQSYDSGRNTSMGASVSFAPEVWAAIVEWVKEERTLEV